MNACRSCSAPLAEPFLTLGASPLSNAYLPAARLTAMEPTYPLDLYYCDHCHLVQLDELESAENIFAEDYAYFSSYSTSWLAHCARYADMAIERFQLGPSSFVIELASNDGYLLQYFQQRGIPLLGVEPARGVAERAIAKGIATDIAFFGIAHADVIRSRGQQADLLAANNVLAHTPNINDFVGGVARVLAPSGVATFEFPHLLRLLDENQFDTIYHEHFSYLSLHAVEHLFDRHDLAVFDVEQLPTHGGSLRVYAQLKSGGRATSANVAGVLEQERAGGLLAAQRYIRFREQVAETKRRLLTLLVELKRDGKRIVGYGAPAKGNTLLNYCGVRTDFVDYTVDSNPQKQGRFLPGTRIPIHAPERILADRPEYILILPWNLKEEIMAQLRSAREWGAKFIIPIPVPTVV